MPREIVPMLLAGDWVGRPDEYFEVRDPQDSKMIACVANASMQDVERAMAAAWSARQVARAMPTHERMRVLRATAESVAATAEEFARLIASEGIKTIREARAEVGRCVETLRLSAEEARRFCGETLNFDQRPGSESKAGWWIREPVGVVLAITPFNDPLNLVAHKIGPALAAGNAVILKPHSATPLTAILLARHFMDAGLPPELLQVITGDGRRIGAAMVADPRINYVTFTGGPATGHHVLATAGMKRVQLELGGNAPAIVLADADLPHAVAACVSGAFWAAGQNCLHVQRIFVQHEIYAEFRDRFAAAAARYVVGDKLSEKTDMGPQINMAAVLHLEEKVLAARQAGGRVITGGNSKGAFYAPTLMEGVPCAQSLAREEVFGPVTLLDRVGGLDEGIQQANATPYGLQAAVFTRDIGSAFRAARELDCGGVMINESSDYRIDAAPFGGTKASGLGREGVRSAVDSMSEQKVVCFNLVH